MPVNQPPTAFAAREALAGSRFARHHARPVADAPEPAVEWHPARAIARVDAVADDPASAAAWFHALHGEGIEAPAMPLDVRLVPPASLTVSERAFAVIVHVSRRLHDSLGALRQWCARDPTLPLMVVCEHLRDLDHVLALEMGADDVVDGAASSTVVAARLRSLARRRWAVAEPTPTADHYRFGALALHLRERRVVLRGADIALTEGEFEVLWLLASQAGQAVSRAELLRRLRGLPYQRIDRSIDCRVYRLRAKLGDADGAGQRIRTVRNCGYLFSPAPW